MGDVVIGIEMGVEVRNQMCSASSLLQFLAVRPQEEARLHIFIIHGWY